MGSQNNIKRLNQWRSLINFSSIGVAYRWFVCLNCLTGGVVGVWRWIWYQRCFKAYGIIVTVPFTVIEAGFVRRFTLEKLVWCEACCLSGIEADHSPLLTLAPTNSVIIASISLRCDMAAINEIMGSEYNWASVGDVWHDCSQVGYAYTSYTVTLMRMLLFRLVLVCPQNRGLRQLFPYLSSFLQNQCSCSRFPNIIHCRKFFNA
jgi:hypothetical protein